MPPVDLVSACAGGGNDRKVICETLADDDLPENEFMPDEEDTDFPPESFWLSKDAEYDWFDRNAFFERRDSTKGNANSTSLNPNSSHSSQRFSFTLKSKASIIGLPKTQKNAFMDSSRRTCRSMNVRLFPKRSTSATVAIIDPGSPNVSCIGRVRSKRGRRKSKKTEKPREKSKTSREKPVEKPKTGTDKKKKRNKKKKKGGFYSKLMSVFRSKKADKNPDSRSSSHKIVGVAEEKPPAAVEAQWRSLSHKAASEPPSLGGLTRFASGRRSGSWAAEDFNQVVSESLELDRSACGMGRS